ncbi:hypothetical protein Clacol_003377 [Clathrus columnatus]|uniref:CMP/dCMP-type deaminase domain-containing protein n=1 Tax=Clathrus columnatus TaxID=1419009 RepID=A0AAV5A855_9AGAM|nr:hypothetical protein Clacol_003377 [Clathrus columnatus]
MLVRNEPAKPTPPSQNVADFDKQHMKHALAQAEIGFREGGVPIGAALVTSDGVVLGVGRNRRVQNGSAIRHGEDLNDVRCSRRIVWKILAVCLRRFIENVQCSQLYLLVPCAPAQSSYSGSKEYKHFIIIVVQPLDSSKGSDRRKYDFSSLITKGAESTLREYGVELINLDLDGCKKLMTEFIKLSPAVWNEDVGED